MRSELVHIESEELDRGSKQASNGEQGIVYAISRHGHRGSYLDLFANMFELEPCDGALNRPIVKQLWRAEKLLFATLDDTVIGFALIAILRIMTGRRTVGIMLRPQSCRRDGNLVARAKYWLFRMLSAAPKVSVLSIVPHSLRPETATVSSGWVHDPQLWDYARRSSNPAPELCEAISARAAGRPVLVFVGSITSIKGVKLLAKIAMQLERDVLIVAAGKTSSDADFDVQRLIDAGAFVENRRISDREIEALYEMADMVWCCYRPDYDQASGIFGRAAQFERPAVVREGSMIAQYSRFASIASVPIPWDDAEEATRRILEATAGAFPIQENTPNPAEGWRVEFEERVTNAL